jgi:hypothetical protein
MEIKISEEKLEKIIDTIVNGVGISDDIFTSFQSRSSSGHFEYIQFLTPGTRANVIARMYPDLSLIVLNDEKLYDLISTWVGSHKLYDLIKDDVIKQIYKKYTNHYRRLRDIEIRNIKHMDDEQFNKK